MECILDKRSATMKTAVLCFKCNQFPSINEWKIKTTLAVIGQHPSIMSHTKAVNVLIAMDYIIINDNILFTIWHAVR